MQCTMPQIQKKAILTSPVFGGCFYYISFRILLCHLALKLNKVITIFYMGNRFPDICKRFSNPLKNGGEVLFECNPSCKPFFTRTSCNVPLPLMDDDISAMCGKSQSPFVNLVSSFGMLVVPS